VANTHVREPPSAPINTGVSFLANFLAVAALVVPAQRAVVGIGVGVGFWGNEPANKSTTNQPTTNKPTNQPNPITPSPRSLPALS
jgi:hypothetical protein